MIIEYKAEFIEKHKNVPMPDEPTYAWLTQLLENIEIIEACDWLKRYKGGESYINQGESL